MRKTKIVCTLGPASSDRNTIKQMVLAGMNVARFNMSHGTHQSHHELIELVKSVREELNTPVAIMIDTKGPEIRIRQFEKGEVNLVRGRSFVLTTRDVLGNDKGVSVTLKTFNKIVKPKDYILLNDGLIKLQVVQIAGEDVICSVVVGGKLSNNKSLNIPGVDLDLEYLSQTDKQDILFGIQEGADIFSISFVGCAKDVEDVRRFLKKNNYERAMICSKIESHKSINNIDGIIAASDSVMVARGDLGVEIEFEKIPYLQKLIINKCLEQGKNVITATEMLESMIHSIRPTRAEISDVANAVHDGTSAIMLSGETSAGEYPVLSVQTMSKIAETAEATISYNYEADFDYSNNVSASVGYAACHLARSLGAKAIVATTTTGFAAKSVSRFRPSCYIIACTPNKDVYYQLAVLWGVVPVMDRPYESTDELLASSKDKAVLTRLVKKGDLIVQTASVTAGESGSNLLVVEKI